MGKGRYLDNDGNTIIYAKDLGNNVAGVTLTKKFFIQNILSRVTGSIVGSISQYEDSDLSSLMKWALCSNTLSCPYNVSASLVDGGSLSANTRYYYRITAFNDTGETAGSLEVSALTTSTQKAIKLTWDQLSGAEGYIIYRSTDRDYTSARRMIIEDPATVEWTDNGVDYDPSTAYGFPGINSDFDLPDENTTAGESPNYGTAPTLDTGDLTFGNLQPGEQKAFWIGVYSTVSTPENENPRNALLQFAESS